MCDFWLLLNLVAFKKGRGRLLVDGEVHLRRLPRPFFRAIHQNPRETNSAGFNSELLQEELPSGAVQEPVECTGPRARAPHFWQRSRPWARRMVPHARPSDRP